MGWGHSADFNYFAKERVSKAAPTCTGCWQAPVYRATNKGKGEGRGKSKMKQSFLLLITSALRKLHWATWTQALKPQPMGTYSANGNIMFSLSETVRLLGYCNYYFNNMLQGKCPVWENTEEWSTLLSLLKASILDYRTQYRNEKPYSVVRVLLWMLRK